ncbi:hypothetical protein [Streptomyces sp. NPDC093149]|uniref:hypothetical protein n=1 Tax=Streptomyces sp. NPDC093149 TaxID=3366031 RepID=UPI0038150243
MTSLRIGLIPARDPKGFAQLEAVIESASPSATPWSISPHSKQRTPKRAATPSCWLRELGTLPAEAPSSLRYLANISGQVSTDQLVDRFGVRCNPVRDLLVNYFKERQPGLDYTTLNNLSRHLASNFWGDLEQHRPGIDSLHLAPEVSAAWKQRCQTRIERRRQPDGKAREVVTGRANVASIMLSVRAF